MSTPFVPRPGGGSPVPPPGNPPPVGAPPGAPLSAMAPPPGGMPGAPGGPGMSGSIPQDRMAMAAQLAKTPMGLIMQVILSNPQWAQELIQRINELARGGTPLETIQKQIGLPGGPGGAPGAGPMPAPGAPGAPGAGPMPPLPPGLAGPPRPTLPPPALAQTPPGGPPAPQTPPPGPFTRARAMRNRV